jgi:hypothetical protein
MKKIFICMCVLAMCSGVFAEEKKVDEQGKLEKEKPDTRSVVVDAWLIRVDADALAKSGVRPLSEKDKENVSVMNLIWCLNEPNSAKVMASARIQSHNYERAECESEKVEYVKSENGMTLPGGREVQRAISFNPYTSSTNLRTTLSILDDKKIRLEYYFKANDFIISDSNSPAGENRIQFNNIIILPDKKAVIAAQSQTGKEMFFLVLKGEIVE